MLMTSSSLWDPLGFFYYLCFLRLLFLSLLCKLHVTSKSII